MFLSKTLSFYKLERVKKAIVEQAKNKEIAVKHIEYFGKRPDVLLYEDDIIALAMNKATSFHCSEEIWKNPLNITNDMKKQDLEELRIGWDLILDIDCHHFAYSKAATHILIKILLEHGISNVTCKFSGNKGFHISVPFESFPDNVQGVLTKDLFPEAPRRIAQYLKYKLKPLLEKAIMKIEKNDINNVSKRTGIVADKLVRYEFVDGTNKPWLDVESFLEIDTILIAPRHLYRMPYSFHEKSWLVSVPVDINKVLKFNKDMALPENVVFNIPFLPREKSVKGEASRLIIEAYDYMPKQVEQESTDKKSFDLPEQAVSPDLFPPCIKNMFKGSEDGRKRTLFSLTNFLKGAGWGSEEIKIMVDDWNKKNAEPLREVLIKGQLKVMKKNKEIFPPHNCRSYYEDLRVCAPDSFCGKIKNPLQYALLKQKMFVEQKSKVPRLTEEQKEMRRSFRAKKKKENEENNHSNV